MPSDPVLPGREARPRGISTFSFTWINASALPYVYKILVSPTELSGMMRTEPVVLIDTRDPAIYGAYPGAVNIREVFTPGLSRASQYICRGVRQGGPVRRRDGGRLRVIAEYGVWPILPRLRSAALTRLSQDPGPARRVCRMGCRGPTHLFQW